MKLYRVCYSNKDDDEHRGYSYHGSKVSVAAAIKEVSHIQTTTVEEIQVILTKAVAGSGSRATNQRT